MEPNVRLLLILTSGITLALGGAFLLLSRRPPRSIVLRKCGFGLLGLCIAFAAMAARNIAPPFVSIVLANTMVALALVKFFSATRHLEKRQPPRPDLTGWLLAAVVGILCAWYALIAPDMAARIVLVNGVAAFLTGRIALNVARFAMGSRGWLGAHVLSGLLWFVTFVLTVTSGITAFTGEPSQDLFNPSVPLATLWTVNPLLLALLPVAILWVVRHGQRRASHDYVLRSHEESRGAREAFMRHCDQTIAHALQDKQPLVFALVDLDNFKQTAAEHGFPVANQLLKWVEEQITGSLRVGDEMARYSVDRFAILLPHMEQSKALLELDSLRKNIELGTCTVDGIAIKTTVSIGIAQMQPGRTSAMELASAAQLAIYRARRSGRNSIDAAGDTYIGFDMTGIDKR